MRGSCIGRMTSDGAEIAVIRDDRWSPRSETTADCSITMDITRATVALRDGFHLCAERSLAYCTTVR